MGLAEDIADDLSGFDGVETVTVEHRTLAGVVEWRSFDVVALKLGSTAEPVTVGQGAQMHATRARWHLQANTLSRQARKGDRILSDGYGTWELENAALVTLGTRYACDSFQVAPTVAPALPGQVGANDP